MNCLSIHRKLRAFTLLELVVGMILSTLVVAATFSAYRIVSTQYRTFDRSSQENNELSFFCSTLQSDLEKADKVELNSGSNLFVEKDSVMIRYVFRTNDVLRISTARTDTIHVITTEIKPLNIQQSAITENELIRGIAVAIRSGEKIESWSCMIPGCAKDKIRFKTKNDH